MVTIPAEVFMVALWVILAVISAEGVFAVAMYVGRREARADARFLQLKVRRLTGRVYRSPGGGEFEQCRADDHRGPVGGRHA